MSGRTTIEAVYESDRSYVKATEHDNVPNIVTTYYYADEETATVPFTLAMDLSQRGEAYISFSTPEFGEWLRALTQLYNDAIRDGR